MPPDLRISTYRYQATVAYVIDRARDQVSILRIFSTGQDYEAIRLVAYAVARATHEDMRLVRSFLTDDDLRHALDHAPPGIIDPRSWT